jgi:7-carboxy-7-deazaguanine synthase
MVFVNEVFETIQGEAHYTGTPAVFVRLQGCPVGCGWCDTKHTWKQNTDDIVTRDQMLSKQADAPTYAPMSAGHLIETLRGFRASHVVITGGEPCLFDLTEITHAIIESGRSCQIETSGTYPIRADLLTYVTVSPKVNMPGGLHILPSAIKRADEIKHPVGKQRDIDLLVNEVLPHAHPATQVWLQPISQSAKATALCVKAATDHGWKVSIQTHKYLGVR